MENKKGISGKVWLIIICIILVVFAIIGVAGYIHYSKPANVDYEEESGGDVSLTYTDDVNEFVITNAENVINISHLIEEAGLTITDEDVLGPDYDGVGKKYQLKYWGVEGLLLSEGINVPSMDEDFEPTTPNGRFDYVEGEIIFERGAQSDRVYRLHEI